MSIPTILMLAAVLIVVVLAAIAARLWWRVRQLERARAQRAEALAVQQAALREERERGLEVIARALLDEQVGLSEACLRLAYLMDALEWPPARRLPYDDVTKVAAALAHIPTHAAWQALPQAERLRYEVEMVQVEERHGAGVRRAARQLVAELAAG